MGYKEIALPMAERGVPTIPLRPRTKVAFLTEWEEKATLSPEQIAQWDTDYPNANGACVAYAKPGGVWFFEVDRPEVITRIESETGQKLPRTFRVRSSPGRGHYYFRHTSASLAVGNVSQNFVKHNDWSMRADRQYVVAPGSIHPKSGMPYQIVSNLPIIPAPSWLLDWCVSQKQEAKKTAPSIEGAKIPRGAHDDELTRIAGKLRYDGMEEDMLTSVLIEICEKRCEDYGDDYKEMCEKISHSICRYPVPVANPVTIGGIPAGTAAPRAATASVAPVVLPPRVKGSASYPEFPHWVMWGTSIYDGFVKPVCDVNSRYEEFMFMPAMAILMNYIGGKERVRIEFKGGMQPSLFLALIGEKGRLIKSSSVEDAIKYFGLIGVTMDWNPKLNNAEGKSLIMTAGSPEGLGIEMYRLQCKNGILYYDELSTLTNKAGIDSSSLTSALLGLYESSKFSNMIKAKKDTYNLEAETYCASMIVCSTDENFLKNWSKLAGASSGLDDRFSFLYQPKTLKKVMPYTAVNIAHGAAETRKLIDKALDKKVYNFVDQSPLSEISEKYGNRVEIRAEKYALGFAVDLGRDDIDDDCVERARALVKYEHQVKRYLKLYEAFTREGMLQMEIKNSLFKSADGEMTLKALKKAAQAELYGTSLWGQAYYGLIKSGAIYELGTGSAADPVRVILVEAPDED